MTELRVRFARALTRALTLLESGASPSAKGRRQKLVYDTRGRLTEVRRCTDYATTCSDYKLFRKFGYDSESQRLWAEDFSEDGSGNLLSRRTKLFYDVLGRMKKIEDPWARRRSSSTTSART